MGRNGMPRRNVLGASIALAAGIAGGGSREARPQQRQQVRWSGGSEPPRIAVPANATDCHFHIYEADFPVAPYAKLRPPPATVEDYQALRRRLGITRGVLVQPSTYGTNNGPYLALLPQLGADRTRMIAVVDPSVTDGELEKMHAAGVRGIRFNLAQTGATTIEMFKPLLERIHPLGWHIQINMPGEQIVAAKDVFLRARIRLVFDHLAHVPQPEGVDSPTFALMRRLLDRGNTWIKLSGAY